MCVYTFIPNPIVKIVESDDEKYIADRARISSIRSSWADGKDYSALIALARTAAKETAKEIRDFEFVINDKYTYYKLADFKSKTARDTYYRVVQMKADENRLTRQLEEMRSAYSKAAENIRRNMGDDILNTEKQLERISKEIPGLEMQARNQEIESNQ